MMDRRAGLWAAGALALVGAALVGVRSYHRSQVTLDTDESLWRITYRAKFNASRVGARIRLTMPNDTPHARVFHEDIVYSGLSAHRLRSSRPAAREVNLTARRRGSHSLTVRFDLHVRPGGHHRGEMQAREGETGEAHLRATTDYPLDDPLLRQTLERATSGLPAGAELAQHIHDYCAAGLVADDHTNDVVAALRSGHASGLGMAQTMVALCRAAKVPARLVTGFRIEEEGERELQHRFWVEALVGRRWVSFDPAARLSGVLPVSYVPVRRDGIEILRGTDITDLETRFTIVPLPPGSSASRIGRTGVGSILDLTRLPLEMHDVLAVLLLMPLGALVTAFFRTVVGLQTFGTFTPTLLALSFVYAEPLTGLLTFAVVIVLGLTSRTFLDRLKLLMVPRLSVVLTLVTLLIVFTVSVLDYFSLTPSAQAVILPLVILTMTVERFYLTSEEDSPVVALKLLATTVFLAGCCYAVLRWKTVGRMVLAFPEVHLFTIGVLILMGRYSGYRLTELYRFQDLVGKNEDAGN